MRLPRMKYSSGIGKTVQEQFGGYQHTLDAGNGAIWDMMNMSSRYAPLLATRQTRKVYATLENPNGIFAMEKLAWVDGGDFYYDGTWKMSVQDGRKRFAALGDYVIVLPDMVYFNTATGETGPLEQSVTLQNAELRDGFIYGERAEENTLYSASVDFHEYFRAGDAVEISGMSSEENNKTPIIREISEDGHSLYFSEYAFVLEQTGSLVQEDPEPMQAQLTGIRYVGTQVETVKSGAGYDERFEIDQKTAIECSAEGAQAAIGKVFIQLTDGEAEAVSGNVYYTIVDAKFTGAQISLELTATWIQKTKNESGVTIRRAIPDMDYLCSNENRLWGCKADTIYASKPGDPFNWNVFDGLGTDSYAVDAGSPGDFTGCVSYLGYPVFFKANRIYKVYGTLPSNFELIASATMGVDEGSGDSLAIAGETLYYLAQTGVTAYAGAMPAPISAAFGDVKYKNAVAGTDGLKYYISMQDEDGYRLFVYDTQKGMWHREDDIEAIGFARTSDGAYMLSADGRILQMETASDEQVPWFAEFGDFTESSPNRKGVGRLQIRMELAKGTRVRVELNFDGRKKWETVMDIVGTRDKQSFVLPIVPRRTDHWRLRLSGTGQCVVYSIAREYYRGSEYR